MEERKPTGLEWNYLPLPSHFDYVFLRTKKPYFDEEKAFWEAAENKSESGKIIVAYDPHTGKCAYLMHTGLCPFYSDVAEALGINGIRRISLTWANSWKDRTRGIRIPYANWEVVGDMLVFRVYQFYLKNFKNYGKPDMLKEIFRIVFWKGNVWQENAEGITDIPWKSYSKFLGDTRWYRFYPSTIELRQKGFDIADITSIGYDLSPYEFLTFYAQLPSGDRIFKYVPDEVRKDLEVPHDGVYAIPGHVAVSINDTEWNVKATGIFMHSERLYVGRDAVYFFAKNPWTNRYMSVTHRKKFSMNDMDVSSLPFSEDVFFQKFEGLANLAQTVYKTKTEKLRNFPCTMYLAGKSLAVEQLLKMGFYGFCGGVYGIKVEKEEFGENAREFLGVPNLVFKILKNDKSADISFLCSTRKDRQELFELAEKNNIGIDPRIFYESMLLNQPHDTCLIAKYYVLRGKSPNKILGALMAQRRYESKRCTYGRLRDYLRMRELASTVSVKPYPEFIKPSAVDHWHSLVVRDYNRALMLEEIREDKKAAGKFKRAVGNKEYKALEFADDEFSVLAPRKPEDLINEGAELSHCVGSYIGDVAAGRSKIYFLRRNTRPEEPYCTVEVRNYGDVNEMLQCFCEHDTHDGDPARIAFVEKWCGEKNIEIACAY